MSATHEANAPPARRGRVIDRGPNWLYVSVGGDDAERLADDLWRVAEDHFVYRLVLEMHRVESVDPALVAGIRRLRERLAEHGGALRLCGLNDRVAAELLSETRCGGLRNHASRRAAVVGDGGERVDPASAETPPPRYAR